MGWQARVQDRRSSACAVPVHNGSDWRCDAFLAFCGAAPRTADSERLGPVYTRLAEGGGADFPPVPSCEQSYDLDPSGGSQPPVPPQPHEIWDEIRDEIRRETPDFKFHIWIDPLELAGVHGLTVYVRAPEHIRMSVTERYLPLLRRAAAARFDAHATVEVVGTDWQAPAEQDGAGGPGLPATAN